ncbi:IclR family transcriptional regulator [Humibacter ginsenosidimutans]|uniref:IclR family transcriptional regulator n=1 Tax=Humibacter ginsenosidimutans TaxID=2599293 RepID=A0A5B8M3Q9_9MICO|nr:IclR family transcriptional regulator [Humibacter ginsenosidimutans]QDZ15247.1 IclR family transcriptional regulator [Humibacter ginsenosidimutans]
MSQTIQRATELIEFIAEAPRTLADCAARFDSHRSTVFRQLQTLQQAGFLLHGSDSRYTIGPRIISIAHEALDHIDLRRVAHDELRALHSRVGNTIHLAQLLEDSIVYIDKVEDTNGVRMYSRIGKPVLPHCTGVGKVILSRLPVQRRDEVLAGTDWSRHTPSTLTSRAALDSQLEVIAERGWGVDDGEFEDFMNCIAAPVSNSTGDILGAISISSIRVVNDLDALTAHVDELLETAARISRQLG